MRKLLMAAALRSAATALHKALPVERFSVAPMMDYTDRHFRHLFRLLSRESVLYTEMVTANTLVDDTGAPRHGKGDRWLAHDDEEDKTILQLGGSSPKVLGAATELAMAHHDYAGVNLNCGCPSERVAGAGCFGAALMRDPDQVASCVQAMNRHAPVSVKCRIGVVDSVRDLSDDEDELYASLARFVETVSSEGVSRFIVHARVAVLSGLSPDANRKVPPILPGIVQRLQSEFPALEIVTNGEVGSVDDVLERSTGLQGAMVGRDACRRPWHYAVVDEDVFGATNPMTSRRALLDAYASYCDRAEVDLAHDGYSPRRAVLKPALSLFHGDAGAGAFKRAIDALHKDASLSAGGVLRAAAEHVPGAVLDAAPGEGSSCAGRRRRRNLCC
jgi:tRNA-dihydrouridine synthase A